MRKQMLAALALTAFLLSACGQVDEPAVTQSPGGPDQTAETSAPSEEPEETTTSAIQGQEIETTTTETTTVELTTTEAPTETTTEAPETPEDPQDLDSYIRDILNGPYGFEIYNDGHLDAWEQREACAALILEASAEPGTEYTAVDETIAIQELDDYEHKGFRAHIKFEEPKPFRVGADTVEGETLMVLGEAGDYRFFIESRSDEGDLVASPMYDFDQEYVPEILKAAQGS